MVFSGAGWAAETETPEWFFHDIVDIDFVKANIAVPMPENVALVDARPKRAKYDKGHIPTAISIPDSQFEALQGKLPRDNSTPLIFYCGGYT